MDRTELCKQLKDGTFYFYKFGLLVKLPVAEVIDKEDFIELNFANNGGYVDVLFTPLGYGNAEPRDTPRKEIDEFVEALDKAL